MGQRRHAGDTAVMDTERGASAVEYAVLVVAFAVVVLAIVVAVGQHAYRLG